MKFNFDKHIPDEEKEPKNETAEQLEELSEEERQEKFEQECIAEAEKLDLKLSELKQEIDSLGGPEKFAQQLSNPRKIGFSGEYDDSKLEWRKSNAEKKSRQKALGAMGFFVAGAIALIPVFESQGVRIDPAMIDNIQWVIQNKSQAFVEGQNFMATALSASLSAAGALAAGSGISDFFKKRRIARHQEKATLMRKMSGAE